MLAECEFCVSDVVLCERRKLISYSFSMNSREKRRKRPAQDRTEQILCGEINAKHQLKQAQKRLVENEHGALRHKRMNILSQGLRVHKRRGSFEKKGL